MYRLFFFLIILVFLSTYCVPGTVYVPKVTQSLSS